jgi:hypothetical protein
MMPSKSPFHPTPRGFWISKDNRRAYFDWVAKDRGFHSLDDWYLITQKEIRSHGHDIVGKYYSSSLFSALTEIYPEHDWNFWMFRQTSRGLWDEQERVREYLRWLGDELDFHEYEDWYRITVSNFRDNHGATLVLNKYGGHLHRVVTENFPEYDWKLWMFNRTPSGMFDDWMFRKEAIEWFAIEIGIERPEDWYRVSRKKFKENRLWGMLSHQYSSSVFNLVNDIYPKIDWKPWLFEKAPNALWNDEGNWNEYLDWFEEKMEIIEPTDWYRVTRHDFVRLRGGALLSSKFSGSPQQVALYRNPEFPWKRWRFQQVADGYWENPDNCKQYLDYLAEIMEIKKVKDWYKITRKHFEDNEGGGILASFNLSPYAVISQHIEGEGWKPWLFGKAPNGFWQDEENQRWYMDWLAGELGITELDGWYIYDRDVLNSRKGGGLLRLYSTSLARILINLYPNHDWDIPRLLKVGKTQKQIHKIIEEIFPGEDVISNFKHPDLRFSGSNYRMELDIWVPSMMLAIEYQGEQHFTVFMRGNFVGSESELESLQRRDQEKREACAEAGIQLIEVDSSWDRKKESIEELVR